MPLALGIFLTGEGSETGTSLISSDMMSTISEQGANISASVSDLISTVLPIALGIMGLVMAITIGIRLFKKLTKSGASGT